MFTPVVLAVALAAAPTPAAKAEPSPADKARKALDEPADFRLDGGTLADLGRVVKERFKIEVAIDTAALAATGMDPSQPVVTVAVKGVRLRDALKTALAPLHLRAGVVAEGLIVSTEDGVVQRQMRQAVDLHGGNEPLRLVLGKLVGRTGANVVLDPRVAKKFGDTPVDLTLDDVPLETVVRLVAEVSGLRAVRMNNVLFLTTDERAKVLREDADGPTPLSPAFPFLNDFGRALPPGANIPPAAPVVPPAAPPPATKPDPPRL